MRAVVLALLAVAAVATTAGAAIASTPPDAGGDLVLAQGGETVRGVLRDGEGEPVPDVAISVATPDGEVVGETATDADGAWEVGLPAPGDYVVTLDAETLPEGVDLRDADRNPLEVTVRSAQNRTLIFALGEGAGGSRFLNSFLAQAVSGLRFGLIIAITAIGLSLIFGTTGLVNFAHGELVALGAIIAFFFNAPASVGGFGLTLILAGLIATVLSAAAGGAIELGLWRPLRKRRTGLIQMLVISIGLALLLRNALQVWFGGGSRPYYDYTIQQSLVFGPIRITPRDLIVMALATIVLVGVATMLQRTRIGKAMRAVSDNRDLAESSGIDVQRVILIIWVIGGGLAGFGGVLAGVVENVSYLMGFRLLLLMFAGVILGGLGTAYGAMFGSIVVGLITELSTLWFSTELKYVWALGVLILILLVRPQGLLGRAERIG
ncbi:MAG: branched-chain amino acid ABC transporter permease [Actinobacteria bacterium]|jgi:branched-chain amino acid transport system permease protein|nr:branched-chain amino acid ABC transporter permease [Actinomycetota bacterium]